MDGVIVLNKPAGWTSHDAVAKIRRLAQTKKVGHLGTLDPMATGVLPLVIGGAKDTPQYPEQAKHVAESIPGAQLELIENVGHVPQFESPEIFHAKLVAFLETPPAGTR